MRGVRAVPSMGNPLGKKTTNALRDASKSYSQESRNAIGAQDGVWKGSWEVETNGKRETILKRRSESGVP